MGKIKRPQSDLQNTTQKTVDRETRISLKTGVNSAATEIRNIQMQKKDPSSRGMKYKGILVGSQKASRGEHFVSTGL